MAFYSPRNDSVCLLLKVVLRSLNLRHGEPPTASSTAHSLGSRLKAFFYVCVCLLITASSAAPRFGARQQKVVCGDLTASSSARAEGWLDFKPLFDARCMLLSFEGFLPVRNIFDNEVLYYAVAQMRPPFLVL